MLKEFLKHQYSEVRQYIRTSLSKEQRVIGRKLMKRMILLYSILCVSSIILILLLESWAVPIVTIALIASVFVLFKESMSAVRYVTSFGTKSTLIVFYGFIFPVFFSYITFVVSAVFGGLPLSK